LPTKGLSRAQINNKNPSSNQQQKAAPTSKQHSAIMPRGNRSGRVHAHQRPHDNAVPILGEGLSDIGEDFEDALHYNTPNARPCGHCAALAELLQSNQL
jgi:hypothetical protein